MVISIEKCPQYRPCAGKGGVVMANVRYYLSTIPPRKKPVLIREEDGKQTIVARFESEDVMDIFLKEVTCVYKPSEATHAD